MQNLPHLTTVTLHRCLFESIPSGIEYLKEVTELDLSGCSSLVSLPSSIWNLSHLTSLNLTGCTNLVSLPSSIENLSNLTSLNLSGCSNLISLPASIRNIIHEPLKLADHFTLPSDFDWSQFQTRITLPSYLDYMIRMNKITCILSSLTEYIKRFDPEGFSFKRDDISDVYGLIKRRREGGGDLIKHFSSLLTTGGKKKRGYTDQIEEFSVKDERRNELKCLKILRETVYGMSTGRRMRKVWKDEGKEDSERRREWEKRRREAGDIMNEEDMSEVLVMHFHYIRSVNMKQSIFIKTVIGKSFPLEVQTTDTVYSVKEKIYDEEDIHCLRLLYGRPLEDGRTLQDYHIDYGSTVYVVGRFPWYGFTY